MSTEIYPSPARVASSAAIKDPIEFIKRAGAQGDDFWAAHAHTLSWTAPWDSVRETCQFRSKWFVGAKTNITLNCYDRHLPQHSNSVALTALGEDGSQVTYTYQEALDEVCRIANVLKSAGVKKGDRVVIYMPLIARGVFAMHACARIGAIHSVVYAGIGAGALRDRIVDSGAKVVIYADETYRRGQTVGLAETVQDAVRDIEGLTLFCCQRGSQPIAPGHRDLLAETQQAATWIEAQEMDSGDPLFILYTSGTTGKPKGVVHAHGGYQVAVDWFARHLFELGPDSGKWLSCSDIGWIVGHSYIAYGPFLAGAGQIIREGAPDWPDMGALWHIVERHQVSGMFVSPTLLRMYMRAGSESFKGHSRHSLKLMASAGEPLNSETLRWAMENLLADGPGAPPFAHLLDNFWQTEVASPIIATFPSMAAKPSAAGWAVPTAGIRIVADDGTDAQDGQPGALVVTSSLPYMMSDIWGDPERYDRVWSSSFGGYVTGDLAMRDADGYVTLLGRADDIISSAGHRLGTAEIEASIMGHPSIAECAVIGFPDEIKGEVVRAYIVLKTGIASPEGIEAETKARVRQDLGAVAQPALVDLVESLPKTRSGKILRRLLKSRAMGLPDGDITTLDQ